MKKLFEAMTHDPNGERAQKITLYELTDEEYEELYNIDDTRDAREFLGLPRCDTSEYFTEAGALCHSYGFEIIGKIVQIVDTVYYNI